jgi:F-type H+-transporting ATPase subunit c
METLTGMTPALISNGSAYAVIGAVVSCSVIIAGAAFGISRIGSSAVESMARQPEAGGQMFNTMFITAALIEGITFFALLICFMAVFWAK